MAPSRRAFLLGSAGLAAAGLTAASLLRRGAAVAAADRGMVVGAFQQLDLRTQKPMFSLSIVDQQGKTFRDVALDFHFHGLAPDPLDPGRAALFQKKGPAACEVDLRAGRVVRPIETVAERRFYGHGTFSRDGKLLYASETVLTTQEGVIVVRDGRTLQILGELPSFGANPHDCLLVDASTMAITNGGGSLSDGAAPPNVAFVDVAAAKLLEKVPLPNARWNAGHLAVTGARDLVVVSAPRKGLPDTEPGGITLRPHGAPVAALGEPAATVSRLVGESLSVAVHAPSSVVAVTTPDANLVTFWDLRSGALVKALDLEAPRGVVLTRDAAHFAISHSKRGSLAFFSTARLERDANQDVPEARMSGSHIYSWSTVRG